MAAPEIPAYELSDDPPREYTPADILKILHPTQQSWNEIKKADPKSALLASLIKMHKEVVQPQYQADYAMWRAEHEDIAKEREAVEEARKAARRAKDKALKDKKKMDRITGDEEETASAPATTPKASVPAKAAAAPKTDKKAPAKPAAAPKTNGGVPAPKSGKPVINEKMLSNPGESVKDVLKAKKEAAAAAAAPAVPEKDGIAALKKKMATMSEDYDRLAEVCRQHTETSKKHAETSKRHEPAIKSITADTIRRLGEFQRALDELKRPRVSGAEEEDEEDDEEGEDEEEEDGEEGEEEEEEDAADEGEDEL